MYTQSPLTAFAPLYMCSLQGDDECGGAELLWLGLKPSTASPEPPNPPPSAGGPGGCGKNGGVAKRFYLPHSSMVVVSWGALKAVAVAVLMGKGSENGA